MTTEDKIGLTFDALRTLLMIHPHLEPVAIEAAIDEAERQVKADIAEGDDE